MPASHRKYLLMREAGFTRSEIQRAIDEAKMTAKRRERTKKTLHLQPLEEALEGTKRKIRRFIRKNSGEKVA
jgi:DNA-binding transcriptional MerR regulator